MAEQKEERTVPEIRSMKDFEGSPHACHSKAVAIERTLESGAWNWALLALNSVQSRFSLRERLQLVLWYVLYNPSSVVFRRANTRPSSLGEMWLLMVHDPISDRKLLNSPYHMWSQCEITPRPPYWRLIDGYLKVYGSVEPFQRDILEPTARLRHIVKVSFLVELDSVSSCSCTGY